jgi:protein dithiol:quinone oxidoreductase
MPTRALFAAMAAMGLAAVAAALFTQHQWDMMPCPWCILQRLILLVAAAVALLGAAWPGRPPRRVFAGALLLLSLCGLAAALWQHFVAASSASCNLTLADRIIAATGLDQLWPQMFAAFASCAEASVKLLGVPYVFYSMAIFVLLASAALTLLQRRSRWMGPHT